MHKRTYTCALCMHSCTTFPHIHKHSGFLKLTHSYARFAAPCSPLTLCLPFTRIPTALPTPPLCDKWLLDVMGSGINVMRWCDGVERTVSSLMACPHADHKGCATHWPYVCHLSHVDHSHSHPSIPIRPIRSEARGSQPHVLSLHSSHLPPSDAHGSLSSGRSVPSLMTSALTLPLNYSISPSGHHTTSLHLSFAKSHWAPICLL